MESTAVRSGRLFRTALNALARKHLRPAAKPPHALHAAATPPATPPAAPPRSLHTRARAHAPPPAHAAYAQVSCVRVALDQPAARQFAETLSADSVPAFRWLDLAGPIRGRGGACATAGAGAAGYSSLAAVGQDTLLLARARLARTQFTRLARRLRRRRGQPRLRGAQALPGGASTAGMALAATLAAERRALAAEGGQSGWGVSLPADLLKLLASSDGPRRAGIGWLPPLLRALAAALLAAAAAAAAAAAIAYVPGAGAACGAVAVVAFATRPGLASFVAWVKQCAPLVAARKTLLVDKVRASVAPYLLGVAGRGPVIADYGLFSVVTLTDNADFVYVYAGALSRWCLLGWYNAHDEYDFDRLRASIA